jgi:hypothetical protein
LPCLAVLAAVWVAWAALGLAAVSFGCPESCNDPRRMVCTVFTPDLHRLYT